MGQTVLVVGVLLPVPVSGKNLISGPDCVGCGGASAINILIIGLDCVGCGGAGSGNILISRGVVGCCLCGDVVIAVRWEA